MSGTEIHDGDVRNLILELCKQGESGLLTLQRDSCRCDICFQSGQLVFASSNLKRFQPAEWMERAGWTEASALARPVGGTKAMVDDMVALSCDRVKLVAAARTRLLEIVTDALGWSSGTHRFATGKPVLNQEILLDGSTLELLSEIDRRTSAAAAKVAAAAVAAEKATAPISDSATQGEGTIPPESAAADAARQAAPGTSESPFGARAQPPSAGSLTVDSPPAGGSSPLPADGSGDPEVERMQRHFQAAKGMNHYEVLGVARGANTDAVRESFYELARQYHPDSVNQRMTAVCRSDAEDYFASVTEAYTVLSHKEERAEYDEHLKVGQRTIQRSEKDNVQLARESYKKGKRLAAAGKLHDAFQFFKTAIQMDGENFDYHRDLGVLQMKNPRWQKAAEESLLKAVELRPGDAKTLVQLGLLYKKNRMKRRAEETFRQALEWDPDNAIAQEELGTGQKSAGGGGLKGLFGRG